MKIKDVKCNRPDGMKRGISHSLADGLSEDPGLHGSSKQQQSEGHSDLWEILGNKIFQGFLTVSQSFVKII